MSYEIVFTKLADADIAYAMEWYNEQRADLGNEFYEELIAAIKVLQNELIQHRIGFESLRKINLKRFPFQVFYEQMESQKKIVIMAVFHFKQDLNILKNRI